MLFTDVIRKKRDGGELKEDEIAMLVGGLTDGSVPDEQVSALAMAIFLNAMTFDETARLTRDMAASGRVLDWDALGANGPVIDKHSTGGIGDKVSFLLAPIAAACGCIVPMISGRGLGHTGGTLDKAESIPGYSATPDLDSFIEVVRSVGCAIIGQTAELAPADRRFYAIRDITGTVESIPLITASILSKKIAAGNRALVMDVKVGSGAFMATIEDARALTESILGTGRAAGLETGALITDMNQPLGTNVGNALEMQEVAAYFAGTAREPRLDEVVLALAAEMLVLAGLAKSDEEAHTQAAAALDSGRAAEVFARMVAALGGPSDFLDKAERYLPAAPVIKPVLPEQSGRLAAVDGRAIGNIVIELGGGRRRSDDRLDLSVGFSEFAPLGAEVGAERPIALVHAADEAAAAGAISAVRAACRIAAEPPELPPVIHARMKGADIA